MIESQTRNPAAFDGWRPAKTVPVGLYGELPPLSAHRPAKPSPVEWPLSKSAPVR